MPGFGVTRRRWGRTVRLISGAAAVLRALLLAVPAAASSPTALSLMAPYTTHHASRYFSVGNTTGPPKACGESQTGVSQSSVWSLATGLAQLEQKTFLRVCAHPGNTSTNYAGLYAVLGLLGGKFHVATSGRYNVTTNWQIGYRVNLSTVSKGTRPVGELYGGSSYYDIDASLMLHGDLGPNSTSRARTRSTVLGIGTYDTTGVTSYGVTVANQSFVPHLTGLQRYAGDPYTLDLYLTVESGAIGSSGVNGSVNPPGHSEFRATLDMLRADGFGIDLVSVVVD